MESFTETTTRTVTSCATCSCCHSVQGIPACMILEARCNGQDPDKFLIGMEGRNDIPDYCPKREGTK